MDGTRAKKKIEIKEENLTFYANCFFLNINALLCKHDVFAELYFLENFLRRN